MREPEAEVRGTLGNGKPKYKICGYRTKRHYADKPEKTQIKVHSKRKYAQG